MDDGVWFCQCRSHGKQRPQFRDTLQCPTCFTVAPNLATPSTVTATKSCGFCDAKLASPRRCAQCKNAWYCNRECQRAHWCCHKTKCRLSGGSSGANTKTAPKEEDTDASHGELSGVEDIKTLIASMKTASLKDDDTEDLELYGVKHRVTAEQAEKLHLYTVDIKGLDKVGILRVLWHAAREDCLHGLGVRFDEKKAQAAVKVPIDSFCGRSIHVNLTGDSFNCEEYDKANEAFAQGLIAPLREQQRTIAADSVLSHLQHIMREANTPGESTNTS